MTPGGKRELSVTLGSRIVVLAIMLATQSALAWWLGVADRGAYGICSVYAVLLSVLLGLGTDIAVSYFVSAGKCSASQGLTAALLFGVVASLVAAAVLGVLTLVKPSFFSKVALVDMVLATGLCGVLGWSSSLHRLLTSVRAFGWYSALWVIKAVVELVLVVLFVWAWQWGVTGALISKIVIECLVCIGVVIVLTKHYGAGLQWPGVPRITGIIHYGIRYYGAKVGGEFSLQMGLAMAAMWLTLEDVGLLAVATAMMARTMVIPDTLVSVLLPRVSADPDGRGELIRRCLQLTLVSCTLVLGMVVVFAKPFVIVFFSPSFLPAVGLIQMLMAAAMVTSVGKIITPYLLGTNRPGTYSLAMVAGIAINAMLIWSLLGLAGIWAVVWGTLGGAVLTTAIQLIAYLRGTSLPLRSLFVVSRDDMRQGLRWLGLRRGDEELQVEGVSATVPATVSNIPLTRQRDN